MSVDQLVGAEPAGVTAARLGWAHVQSEVGHSGEPASIMSTFAEVEALTFVPALGGAVRPDVLDTHALVARFYEQTFTGMRLDEVQIRCQASGNSYLFLDADFTATDRASGQSMTIPNLILLPSTVDGVTGEMIFPHLGDTSGLVSLQATTRPDRLRWMQTHDALIRALRVGDVAAVAETVTAGFSVGVRTNDHAATYQAGPGETTAQLARFFRAYEISDVSVVQFVAGDWYIFSETWWTLHPCGSSKTARRFSTAQFAPIMAEQESLAIYGVGVEW